MTNPSNLLWGADVTTDLVVCKRDDETGLYNMLFDQAKLMVSQSGELKNFSMEEWNRILSRRYGLDNVFQNRVCTLTDLMMCVNQLSTLRDAIDRAWEWKDSDRGVWIPATDGVTNTGSVTGLTKRHRLVSLRVSHDVARGL